MKQMVKTWKDLKKVGEKYHSIELYKISGDEESGYEGVIFRFEGYLNHEKFNDVQEFIKYLRNKIICCYGYSANGDNYDGVYEALQESEHVQLFLVNNYDEEHEYVGYLKDFNFDDYANIVYYSINDIVFYDDVD